MNDEEPLDLRGLADVESPDAVRVALQEFRRRALTRYLWVALGAAALVVAAFLYPPERSLVDRIEDADESALVGYSVQVDEATWTLVRVADLGDTIGLEWLVWPLDAGRRLSFRTVSVAPTASEAGSGALVPFEVSRPESGVLEGTIRIEGEHPEPLMLDLQELGVPSSYWR